jgi:hypothetical protein
MPKHLSMLPALGPIEYNQFWVCHSFLPFSGKTYSPTTCGCNNIKLIVWSKEECRGENWNGQSIVQESDNNISTYRF